jgi:hypothetical protein
VLPLLALLAPPAPPSPPELVELVDEPELDDELDTVVVGAGP